jgi:hypothetical protein
MDYFSVISYFEKGSNECNRKLRIRNKYGSVIIIISPLQSTAGHRPLQFLTILLNLRLASSSCQPSYANRHSAWPEGVLHYVYLDAVTTPELVYPSGCQFYG